MRRSVFLAAAPAVVVCALASAWAVRALDGGTGEMRHEAIWEYRPTDAAQMARDVDAVVVAVHVGVRPGRVAESANGLHSLSFELNDFVVEEEIKGPVVGESVTVERAGGGADAVPAAVDYDGGPYNKGQRYLLFLRKQSDTAFFYLVHPEGRYSVGTDRHLATAAKGPAASVLSRRPLRDALALLRAAVAKR